MALKSVSKPVLSRQDTFSFKKDKKRRSVVAFFSLSRSSYSVSLSKNRNSKEKLLFCSTRTKPLTVFYDKNFAFLQSSKMLLRSGEREKKSLIFVTKGIRLRCVEILKNHKNELN